MYRLIYCSTVTGEQTVELIDGIRQKALLKNSSANVTGMLFFNSKYYLQCLEGGRDAVSETYNRICNDDRHKQVELISFQRVKNRLFTDWELAVANYTKLSKDVYYRYSTSKEFSPYELDDMSALEFLVELSKSSAIFS